MAEATAINFNARYSVVGYEGIAFYLTGFAEHELDCAGHPAEDCGEAGEHCSIGELLYCDGSCEEPETNESVVIAVMVGDDREHEICVEDLIEIHDEDYCSGCGQIGCGWG